MEISSSPCSVIIVGAGMSGISAAKTLHEAGISDFVMMEGTNRIGGRIKKTEFGGRTVEMGANWLHGGDPSRREDNPLYEMAEDNKLHTQYSDFDKVIHYTYDHNGDLYSPDDVQAAFLKARKTEFDGKVFAETLRADDDMSILAYQRLIDTEPKTALERMVDYFTFDGEQSEAPRLTSLKYVIPMAEFVDYGEKEYFVADSKGFEELVHLLAKKFLSYDDKGRVDDHRVKFNEAVVAIEQSEDGVTVTTKAVEQSEDGETVITDSERKYRAKIVILSPSIGVLQSNLITFMPELPTPKKQAIAGFSMGEYTKIFLKFDRNILPEKLLDEITGSEFFFYVDQMRGYYAIWQHLEKEYKGSNIMFVTVTDDEAIRIQGQVKEKTQEEAMKVLRTMFGQEIPEPRDIMIPKWKSDVFYSGCFTNWPAGYSKERHNELRAPFERVYFTGEHTHPTLFGYADGAYFAGEETANDVIRELESLQANLNPNGE